MENLEKILKKNKTITLYLTANYPNRDDFFKNLDILVDGGMDILELGIPVKNPHLDGNTIVNTHRKVLEEGFNEIILVKLLRKIRGRYPSLPLVIMAYTEGIERYKLLSKGEYYDAILCPDEYLSIEDDRVPLIQIYNDQMDETAIKERTLNNRGFGYVMSGCGATGSKGELSNGYISVIKKTRRHSSIPLQIGFGIYSPTQVKTVLRNGADGVIIGSEIIRKIDENNDVQLRRYVESLTKARG